mmetsp:Transcript_10144/g.12312  ORF Transcript_10144/g.12312 Transcript_10144/m.12312 type:complete len:171 (-) Transcript_10144:229-741(-)
MNRVKLSCHVGPIYETSRSRYSIDYVLVSFVAEEFHTPRNSAIDELNLKRPARRMKKVNGIINERCSLYPSNDLLGRRDCVEIMPVLSDSEMEFMDQRQHLLITDDASGDLLGMYGLHETLEAIRQDENSEMYRPNDRAQLAAIREVIEEGLSQGLRYGMPMRVTFVQTA